MIPEFKDRLIGSHILISEGLDKAVYHAEKLGCTAIQIFTKSSSQWNAKKLTDEQKAGFLEARQKTGISVPLAHASYLINLASPEPEQWNRSVEALFQEVDRCQFLKIPHLVLHPGSHKGAGVKEGILRTAEGINRLHEHQKKNGTVILLECTAGQGTSIGSKFGELADILNEISDQTKIGICLDTCHLFAAGYDIRTKESFSNLFNQFDQILGIEKIKAFHLNDSQKELGSHVDRHAHIGKGKIGLEGFQYLLNDPRFKKIPMILETPKGTDDTFDLMNLTQLQKLIRLQK
ncbi:MAG: deoxyribonuclease IV [Candidatus Eremiobacteraeota bacterium]|nr:deoxyribonuclease IV [Candidatus Eremiobacteraeota bacterium]MCL5054320.1 deoxyribonuclease IV [Bacillota bacterium]